MKNDIQTGNFARSTENGHSAKQTQIHLVINGKPICGYKPHETMKFQFNANFPHMPYLGCKSCKKKYDLL